MIDPRQCRAHFPALHPEPLLHRDVQGRRRQGGQEPPQQRDVPLLFFDNPGGTQISGEAIHRMQDYFLYSNSNHGGAFRTSRESDAVVLEARHAVADFLGARRKEEIVFGQNMTSLTLHVSRSLAGELSAGDEIVVTRLDHDANIAPWLAIARDRRCDVRWLDFDPRDCSWSVEDLKKLLSPRTKILAIGWASNAVGTVNPVAEAVRLAREAGALTFIDAVHCAPHLPMDVEALGCDLLACSAYKFFGPHTGILFGRYEVLQRLSAYKVRPAGNEPPDKWETGTQSFESIAGVWGAIEYLQWVGETFGRDRRGDFPVLSGRRLDIACAMSEIRDLEIGYSQAMREGLSSIKGLKIRGITDPSAFDRRVPTFAFTVEGMHPRDICEKLDGAGINAWDGNYYAPEVTTRLGLEGKGGMVRVGAVHYNTLEEIESLCAAVADIAAGRRPTA